MQIIDLLEKGGVVFKRPGEHHHARAGWVQIDCPYCSQYGKFHMGLALSRPVASCWRCGSRNIGEVLLKVSNGRIRVGSVDYRHERIVQVSGNYKPPAGAGSLGPLHKGYLWKRGLDADVIESFWHVTGTVFQPGPMLWRLIIPIYLDGRAVSWTSRTIAPPASPALRYISAAAEEEAVPHKTLLYGEEHCAQTVVVCEGPLDVWAVGPGAVCTFGVAFTPEQIVRLGRYSRRLLLYDTEENRAGDKAVAQLGAVLSMLPGTTEIIKLDTGSDPAAAQYEELADLRRHAFGDEYGVGKLRHPCG